MEKVYQYLWKYRMLGSDCILTDGRCLKVINTGQHNHDSGPDFFNARLQIDSSYWAGDVEVHERASDWHRHGHQNDAAYSSVILHAVGHSDTHISRGNGEMIPQFEMLVPQEFYATFNELETVGGDIKCRNKLKEINRLYVTDCVENLAMERLQSKSAHIFSVLDNCGYDWEQCCFVIFARSLGFGLNGDPFERVARSLPLRVLAHHSDSLLQLEALLFGQAGMLSGGGSIFDEYYQTLVREYSFLAKKYDLHPIEKSAWKYLRTRPGNFPHRRLALMARAALGGFRMFATIVEQHENINDLKNIFDWNLRGTYWEGNSSFLNQGRGSLQLSDNSKNSLLINCVAPLLYTYASFTGECEFADSAFNLMDKLPPENNKVTRMWKTLGLEAENASQSQAMLQLWRQYCEPGKCLDCRLGHQVLRKTINR